MAVVLTMGIGMAAWKWSDCVEPASNDSGDAAKNRGCALKEICIKTACICSQEETALAELSDADEK